MARSTRGRSSFATPARPYIAIVGAGFGDADAERVAEQVGRLLAEQGAILVCGGLGGVMEAACRGAKSAQGLTVGLLPDKERGRGNEFLDVAIPTGMGETRNALIVRCADAVIAIGGEFGTLSEIGFALKLGKPVVGLNTWELSTPKVVSDPITRAASPEEAVTLALDLADR